MKKIFVDVGAHRGETTQAAMLFDFDKIYAFEPASRCRAYINISDPKVELLPFGLSSATSEEKIYFGAHTHSSSMFADKSNVSEDDYEMCQFVRASEWVSNNIEPDDFVIMKINCEGAEIGILKDLDEAALLDRFHIVLVYPDYRKVSSLKETGAKIFARILEKHKNVVSASGTMDVKEINITKRTVKWLSQICNKAAV